MATGRMLGKHSQRGTQMGHVAIEFEQIIEIIESETDETISHSEGTRGAGPHAPEGAD